MTEQRTPGASGTLLARLVSFEKKTSSKGSTYASIEVTIGEAKIRGVSYSAEVLSTLEGYVAGESVLFWGTVSSSPSRQDPSRVFSNLKINKVYAPGDREGGDSIYVLGTITDIGEVTKDGKKLCTYVDLDITSNPAYPESLRLQLAYKTSIGDLRKGDTIEVDAYLNKFGIWVFDGPVSEGKQLPPGTKSLRKPRQASSSTPASAPGSSQDSGSDDVPPPDAPAGAPSTSNDDDIPW